GSQRFRIDVAVLDSERQHACRYQVVVRFNRRLRRNVVDLPDERGLVCAHAFRTLVKTRRAVSSTSALSWSKPSSCNCATAWVCPTVGKLVPNRTLWLVRNSTSAAGQRRGG